MEPMSLFIAAAIAVPIGLVGVWVAEKVCRQPYDIKPMKLDHTPPPSPPKKHIAPKPPAVKPTGRVIEFE